jgi:hypothetical protein
VEIPNKEANGGTLPQKQSQGPLLISWYDGVDDKGRPRKRWKKVKGISRREGALLSQALSAKEAKEWELQYPERVKEEVPEGSRPTIDAVVYRYLQQLAGVRRQAVLPSRCLTGPHRLRHLPRSAEHPSQ